MSIFSHSDKSFENNSFKNSLMRETKIPLYYL